MEIGLKIYSPKKVLHWIFQNLTDYTFVFEYDISNKNFEDFIVNLAQCVENPKSVKHNYENKTCTIKSYNNFKTLDNFEVNYIMKNTHVLSLFKDDKMELLIADDYHFQCFTCSREFYSRYYSRLLSENLVK